MQPDAHDSAALLADKQRTNVMVTAHPFMREMSSSPRRAASVTPNRSLPELAISPECRPPHICDEGHTLREFETPKNGWSCDVCDAVFVAGSKFFGCRTCNYDVCLSCHQAGGAGQITHTPRGRRPSEGIPSNAPVVNAPVLHLQLPVQGGSVGAPRAQSIDRDKPMQFDSANLASPSSTSTHATGSTSCSVLSSPSAWSRPPLLPGSPKSPAANAGCQATPSNTPRSVACSVCTWDGRPPVVSTHVEVGSDGSPAGIRDTSLETAIDPLPSCGCPADMSPGETIAPMNTVETKDLCRDDASLCSGQVTATPLLCGSENYRTEESSNENYRTEESSNNPIPESDAGEEPRAHSTENVDPAKRETTTENMASKIGGLDRPFEIATKTIKGKKASNPDWINQDSTLTLDLPDGRLLACVFDGHGEFGHLASNRARELFLQLAPALLSGAEEDALTQLFLQVHAALVVEPWCQEAGTTATCALVDFAGETAFLAHAGDSSCLLVRSGELIYVSKDHKFDGESEERIVASGGEVRFQEGCHRVFVRGQVHPGLACSRSLGDGILSGAAGVSAEPTVSPPLPFGPGSSLILASDGLWDMVSPGVAAQASAAADADSFASSLTKVAHRKWQVFPNCDDITVVVVSGPAPEVCSLLDSAKL